jgi:hypothetical protein
MTRRERLEAKLDKRANWADKARARSEAHLNAAHRTGDRIPTGQPILVGHHSEHRHRRDLERIDSNMSRACEEHTLAERHESKCEGLARMLDRSILDDDPDAVERLEERIREREKSAELNSQINKAWHKGGADSIRALVGELLATELASRMAQFPWLRSPCSMVGIRAGIRADRERIQDIVKKRERAELAASSPGGVLITGEEYVRVTFPEKPAREILQTLREAGFRWGAGSWHGLRAALPRALLVIGR